MTIYEALIKLKREIIESKTTKYVIEQLRIPIISEVMRYQTERLRTKTQRYFWSRRHLETLLVSRRSRIKQLLDWQKSNTEETNSLVVENKTLRRENNNLQKTINDLLSSADLKGGE